MWDLIPNISWLWGGGLLTTALLIAAGAIFGIGSVVKVVSAVAETLIAWLTPLGQLVVDGAVWFARNVLGPGIKDILDDWVTIVTVGCLGLTIYWGAELQNKRQERALIAQRDYFAEEMRGFKATLAKTRQELAQCKQMVGGKMQKSAPGLFPW